MNRFISVRIVRLCRSTCEVHIVRSSSPVSRISPSALCRPFPAAVAAGLIGVAVILDDLAVLGIGAESQVNGLGVGREAVCADLGDMDEAAGLVGVRIAIVGLGMTSRCDRSTISLRALSADRLPTRKLTTSLVSWSRQVHKYTSPMSHMPAFSSGVSRPCFLATNVQISSISTWSRVRFRSWASMYALHAGRIDHQLHNRGPMNAGQPGRGAERVALNQVVKTSICFSRGRMFAIVNQPFFAAGLP